MNKGIYIFGGVIVALGVGYVIKRKYFTDEVVGSDPDADIAPTSTEIPQTIASDINGLGCMLASEAPASTYTNAERLAIMSCALNFSVRRKRSIADIMLPQHHQVGHFCSTFQSPAPEDTSLATQFISGGFSDPTGGALAFFEPAEQEKLYASGKVTHTAQEIRDKWATEDNYHLSATIGRWEFFAPKSASNS